MKMTEDMLYLIYSIIEEIPYGKVTTYGQIARLAGIEKNARMVGRALKISSLYGSFPCHRVVNSYGRITPGWELQATLLAQEGVVFKKNGCVDLKNYQWSL